MVIKNFLTGICVLLAFGATESFGAASIRATTVGASGSTSGGASARTGSMRLSGTKTVSATPTTESSSSATGARMPVLPGGTPKLGTSPKLPSMTGGVSLDGYATEAWTIENFQPIGDYQPAGDYLTESDLNGYATESYVDSAIAGLAPHILIQAGTNNVIYYCIAAGCEDVPVGTEGYWAEFPTDGLTGADGREVELRNNGTYIQWRYKTGSDTAWKNLVKLSDLQGPQGNSPTVVVTEGESGTYTMTVTNADGTTQTVSWTGGGTELPDLSDYVKKSGYTSSDNNKVWQVKKSGSNYVLQLVSLSDVGAGISLDDVATAGYLNDLSGSTYVDADTNGNTGTIALKNITSSRNDITSTSTKLTRAMDVQSYVVNYVANHGGDGGSSTIVYSGLVNNVSDLPTGGLTNGATYYVVSEQSFYIWNGEGWDVVPFTSGLATTSDLDGKQPVSDSLSLGTTGGTWTPVKTGTYVNASAVTGGTKFDIIDSQMAKVKNDITSSSTRLVQAKAVYAYAQPVGDYVSAQSLDGYIKKSDPSYASYPGHILQIKNIAAEGETPNYVATWVELPGGLDESALQTYLTTNNYVNTVDSALSSTSTNPVQNKVVKSALDGKQPKSNAAANTYKVGYTGNTWATLGAKDYVTIDTTTPTEPKIALNGNKIVNTIGDNASSDNLVTEGAVRGAITAALVGQTPEDLQQMIADAVDGQFQETSNNDFQFGMSSGGWKPLIASNYIKINNTNDNAVMLEIPESKLILRDTTASSNPDDEDLVTLGGMRCITSKTTWHGPTPALTGTNTGCKGTRPSSWANYNCYTNPGYTQLQLQNTCLETSWGDAHTIPDECGAKKNNGSFSYTICQGYQEANSVTGTTYNQIKYLLEEPICVTAYGYTQPGSPVTMSQAATAEGDDWAHLLDVDDFRNAVTNSMYSSVGFYTVKGQNKTGRQCGNDTTEWQSELGDSCNQIMQSTNYNYFICTVGTTGYTVDGNSTYLYREPIGIIPKPECEQTTIVYTGPNTTISGGSGTPGSKTNPYTVRGFITTTVTNSCNGTDSSSYVADSCEYVEQTFSTASGDVKATGDLMQCTQGDDNETTYYLKAAAMCALILVKESYSAPNGSNGSYNVGGVANTIYKNKGIKSATYLNPCTGDTKNSAVIDNDCHLVDMGELKTNGETSDNNVIYSCTCGGKPDSTSSTPCDNYTASDPKSYYWKGLTKAVVKQCEVTTTEYVAPGIQQEGNGNLNNNCGTGNQPDCTVRGYSKITTKHNCSNDADTVKYAIDTCVVAKTLYNKVSRAAAPWYETTSATMTTRYQCTKNDGSGNTYYLESSGSGMCGKILVDIGYKAPGSCGNDDVCGVKGKKVKTYLDPCDSSASDGYATVQHEDDEDDCTLSAMGQVSEVIDDLRGSGVTVPQSKFRSICTCGGAAVDSNNVCYGHTPDNKKTYYWDSTVNVCSYKMETDSSSGVKQYIMMQNCDGTTKQVGGMCDTLEVYFGPGDDAFDKSVSYGGHHIIDTFAGCTSLTESKCYDAQGTNTRTPYTPNASNNNACEPDSGNQTYELDTCFVNEELSYSKSNSQNNTYYDCKTLKDGTPYIWVLAGSAGTPTYFKGYEDVGHPADPSNNVSATGVFLTATQAKAEANAASTSVSSLSDALLGTSECRQPGNRGLGGTGSGSGNSTTCLPSGSLTEVLYQYFDTLCNGGNTGAACDALNNLNTFTGNTATIGKQTSQ